MYHSILTMLKRSNFLLHSDRCFLYLFANRLYFNHQLQTISTISLSTKSLPILFWRQDGQGKIFRNIRLSTESVTSESVLLSLGRYLTKDEFVMLNDDPSKMKDERKLIAAGFNKIKEQITELVNGEGLFLEMLSKRLSRGWQNRRALALCQISLFYIGCNKFAAGLT